MNSVLKINRFAAYVWAVLAYNLCVIIWGAYVRASGSGAGCGNHWPLCNGEVVPRSPQLETLIELTHRLTSGLLLALTVGLVVWAFRSYPKQHRIRLAAITVLFFILTEALIGAGLVRFDLVAGNKSMTRALVMSFHLVNTFLLLAATALTAWWASGGKPSRLREQGIVSWLFGLCLLGMLVLTVSGGVAALGDTLFPSRSLAEGLRQDFSATAHILIRLRLLHPLIAVMVGCLLLITAGVVSFMRPAIWIKRLTVVLAALVVVQLGAGVLNVLLLVPTWLQLVHLFLADAVWITLVLLTAEALAQPAQQEQALDHLNLPHAVKT